MKRGLNMQRPYPGQTVSTAAGDMLFRGSIREAEQLSTYWVGRLPNGREVTIDGELPPHGELVAINLPDARTTGVYKILRKAKTPTRLGRRPPEINAAAYAERNAAIFSLAAHCGRSPTTSASAPNGCAALNAGRRDASRIRPDTSCRSGL
jgi:hypothetical protein